MLVVFLGIAAAAVFSASLLLSQHSIAFSCNEKAVAVIDTDQIMVSADSCEHFLKEENLNHLIYCAPTHKKTKVYSLIKPVLYQETDINVELIALPPPNIV